MEPLRISDDLIHPLAIEVCRILNKHQYQAYIVGGCVRDLILGHKPKDWDITTDASPEKVVELFPKTIPTGLQHGTVTVCMGEGIENHFEVTTFRIEGEYSDGRRPDEVSFVLNVEEDLARRDLTINAIAYDPLTKRLVDPFGGIEDLQKGEIKAVGMPEARFQEDGLRIMRAARFAARFGYQIQLETFYGMKSSIDTLKKVSKERIQDELCKTLMSKNPSLGLNILLDCGALEIACPYLCSHPAFLHFLKDQDTCKEELATRLAFLYGNCTPVEKVQEELLALKFSNKEIKKVVFYGKLLDRFDGLVRIQTPASYKSFVALIKNEAPDPWEHTYQQFIILLRDMGVGGRELLDTYSGLTVFSKREMQINGDDLLADGMVPGPKIKEALERCYLEILRHPEHNTKSHLLEVARQH